MKVLIVGAGISGLTAAAVMHKKGHEVVIYETRKQIGGNCADVDMHDGIRLHLYGPHIFHTTSKDVWDFLNQHTAFNSYVHRVVADTSMGVIPIPYNLTSEKHTGPLTDQQIIDLLFVEYSAKMWGRDWEYLPEEITGRVPKRRDNHDCRYFTDNYQGLPIAGYQPMFESMAEGCTVHLNAKPGDWKKESRDLLVYTGLIDEYHDHVLGRLNYKTLDITVRPRRQGESFPAAVVNQCNDRPFTRKADHSWWYGCESTVKDGLVSTEHPRDWEPGDIPYYPIPFGEDQVMANRYINLTAAKNVVFLGRLATYKYLNIDQAVLQALETMSLFT